MKTPIGLTLNLGDRWSVNGATATRGHASLRGVPLEGQAFASVAAAQPIARLLVAADGGYAAVQVAEDGVSAGVDRIRSVPLFYARGDGQMYLSDDAYWIAAQLPPQPFDAVAQAEFLAVGYVTGPDTLHPRIKQLQAGEMLTVKMSNPVTLTTERYFTYRHGQDHEESPEAILDRWETTLRGIIERLVRSAAGRTVVVPLSGGLDSRLLVMELKRLGYDRIQTFTYGVPGNAEASVAKEVAGQLGVPWQPIEYSRAGWRHAFHSPEFADYVRYADGLSTVAHVQDWPAVWELHAGGQVPADAIFVPGHNGGFLFGDWENGDLHRMARPSIDDLIRNLERVHYHNWRLRDQRLRSLVRKRLVDSLRDLVIDGPEAATSAWEWWEWQERQSKFMCNAVRVYEFWGYDWRMPFWDREAINFWERVPIQLRARSRLHRAYVARASERAGLHLPPSDQLRSLRSALMRDYLPERVKVVARRIRGLAAGRMYREHPMAWYGIVSLEQFRKVYSGTETINSILALHRLGLLPSADEERG